MRDTRLRLCLTHATGAHHTFHTRLFRCFDCYEKALAYTPNPGGVGPMTRAMLLQNVVEMAERQL